MTNDQAAPMSASAAEKLARAGDWSMFGPCAGCKAEAGQPCWSLRNLRTDEAVRPTKRRPCADRPREAQ